MSSFDERLSAYRIAKATMDLQQDSVRPNGDRKSLIELDQKMDQLSEAHSEALDSLLLTKVSTQGELLQKLEIIVAEEVHDNWHLSAPIMALALDDARRLIGGA